MRPLLVLTLLLAAVLAGTPASAAASTTGCRGADRPTAEQGPGAAGAATLCLVNAARRGAGLRPLRADGRLRRAGREHARSMVSRRFFSHRGADGTSPVQRIVRAGYRGAGSRVTGGENLGWSRAGVDTPRAIVHAWLASPEHRRVIRHRSFRRAGVAAVNGLPVTGGGAGTTYAMLFATR